MNYRDVLSSDYFFDIYSKIEFLKSDYPASHSFNHIWNVINHAKNLAKLFNLSSEEEQLLLIACTLHDIGYIHGRENHAENGSVMAREFLINKLDLEQTDIVCEAIKSHSGSKLEDFKDNVSMCLILSDKLDFSKTRYRKDEDRGWHDLFLEIEKTKIVRNENDYSLEIHANKGFCITKFEASRYYSKLLSIFDTLYASRKIKINIEIKIIEQKQ